MKIEMPKINFFELPIYAIGRTIDLVYGRMPNIDYYSYIRIGEYVK
jgi:hypothetical protein